MRMELLLRQRRVVAFAQGAQDLLMQQIVRDDDGARRDKLLVALGGRGTPAGLAHEESGSGCSGDWCGKGKFLPGPFGVMHYVKL